MFQIINDDSLKWMDNHKKEFSSVITSLPDMDELGFAKKKLKYIKFLREATNKTLQLVKETGYCIFIQTDRKCNGYIDKSYYITDEAFKLNYELLGHKLVLKTPVGVNNLYKPTYAHILIFSQKGNKRINFCDVMFEGEILYKNGTSLNAIEKCIDFLKYHLIKDICDPFVGQGSVLKIAKEKCFEKGIGIDIDSKQVELTKKNLEIEG